MLGANSVEVVGAVEVPLRRPDPGCRAGSPRSSSAGDAFGIVVGRGRGARTGCRGRARTHGRGARGQLDRDRAAAPHATIAASSLPTASSTATASSAAAATVRGASGVDGIGPADAARVEVDHPAERREPAVVAGDVRLLVERVDRQDETDEVQQVDRAVADRVVGDVIPEARVAEVTSRPSSRNASRSRCAGSGSCPRRSG